MGQTRKARKVLKKEIDLPLLASCSLSLGTRSLAKVGAPFWALSPLLWGSLNVSCKEKAFYCFPARPYWD